MSEYQLTDQMLEEAVDCFAAAMLASLPSPSECEHDFSPEFEAKMERLLKKATKHRKPLRLIQRAAVIFLTIIVSAATWLAVDNEARAAFIRWTREIFGNAIIYRYQGKVPDETIPDYCISKLPDGCELTDYSDDKDMKIAVFTTLEEDGFIFIYYYIHDGIKTIITSVGDDTIVQEPVLINGTEGFFYDLDDEQYADSLFWIDDNTGIAFELQSFWGKDEMLKLAESVVPGKIKSSFPEYALSWVPEGYGLTGCTFSTQNRSIHYENAADEMYFNYFITTETEISVALEIDSIEATSLDVNGMDALFYTEDDENKLVWLDLDTGIAFSLTATEDVETMLKIAESIYLQY